MFDLCVEKGSELEETADTKAVSYSEGTEYTTNLALPQRSLNRARALA